MPRLDRQDECRTSERRAENDVRVFDRIGPRSRRLQTLLLDDVARSRSWRNGVGRQRELARCRSWCLRNRHNRACCRHNRWCGGGCDCRLKWWSRRCNRCRSDENRGRRRGHDRCDRRGGGRFSDHSPCSRRGCGESRSWRRQRGVLRSCRDRPLIAAARHQENGRYTKNSRDARFHCSPYNVIPRHDRPSLRVCVGG